MDKAKIVKILAWAISIKVAVLAIVVWGEGINWKFTGLSVYKFFPLLGLLAFSLMWAHYIASVLRQILKVDKEALKNYFEVTSWAVLVLIILHPGLLSYQLWKDGLGLPPGSITSNYVAPGLGWVIVLAEVSLLVFLAYELRRWFKQKSWWKFVQYASDAAMLAIFYHGLRLGSNLQDGWYRYVWFYYGITLVGAILYGYARKFKRVQRDVYK
ncbi:MAG TPA: hypothetical protein VJJ78_01305 [Candidatus Saccharimonadales bacterium]|nr:hypothetical protein [Candidatus Saccharimonadales bacterium]